MSSGESYSRLRCVAFCRPVTSTNFNNRSSSLRDGETTRDIRTLVLDAARALGTRSLGEDLDLDIKVNTLKGIQAQNASE